ncbi:MAG: hypothetical protein ACR2F1_09290 [Nitrososphaeraceae archaeon]
MVELLDHSMMLLAKKPSGLTSILYDKMAVPFALPSVMALYCFSIPLLS